MMKYTLEFQKHTSEMTIRQYDLKNKELKS